MLIVQTLALLQEPPPEQLSVEASDLRPLRGDFPGDPVLMSDVRAGFKVLCYYAHADALAPAECVAGVDSSRATVHVSFDEWELELEAPVAYLRKRGELQDPVGNISETSEEVGLANAQLIDGKESAIEVEVTNEEGSKKEEDQQEEGKEEDDDAMALLSSMAAQSFSEENVDENAHDVALDLDDEAVTPTAGEPAAGEPSESSDELRELMEGANVDLALLDSVAKACGGASSACVAAAGEKAIVAAGVPSIRARKLHRAAVALSGKGKCLG